MNDVSNPLSDRHQELLDEVLNALNKLFGDNSVQDTRTIESLLQVKEEVNIMLDALGASNGEAQDEFGDDVEAYDDDDDLGQDLA